MNKSIIEMKDVSFSKNVIFWLREQLDYTDTVERWQVKTNEI